MKSNVNSGSNKDQNPSHLGFMLNKSQIKYNSKGKSDNLERSNLGLSSSGRGKGFHFNSDYKRAKLCGPPISASKFVDENDSPQSHTITLKGKQSQKHGITQKSTTPLKKKYFSPEGICSDQKLYKDKSIKLPFNDEVKSRHDTIRTNGI